MSDETPLKPPGFGPSGPRRDLLLSAFQDAEGTVRATDTKASIALVVHGFIFAGLVGVLAGLSSLHDAATCFRTLVIVLTAATGLAFLASVGQLIRCVIPAPVATIPTTPQPCVSYLEGRASRLSGRPIEMPSFDEVKRRVDALDDSAVESELMAELLKVSAIRIRKVTLARSGLELLGLELLLAAVLLAALAVHAL